MFSIFRAFKRRERFRHRAVTTFHRTGYEAYGGRFIETFLANWPQEVSLLVYAEGVTVDTVDTRITVIDQAARLPNLLAFKAAYRGDPRANGTDSTGKRTNDFRWDAVRFSNKVFAVTDAVRRSLAEADQLLWLDADIVTHSPIPVSFLTELAPTGNQLTAYLNRKGYPECGWVGYNLRHPLITAFIDAFEQAYLSGRFLSLKESHDSYVFWTLMQEFEKKYGARWKALGNSRAKGHIFINSRLGAYMDHLKGDRKALGKSNRSDLTTQRSESWWR